MCSICLDTQRFLFQCEKKCTKETVKTHFRTLKLNLLYTQWSIVKKSFEYNRQKLRSRKLNKTTAQSKVFFIRPCAISKPIVQFTFFALTFGSLNLYRHKFKRLKYTYYASVYKICSVLLNLECTGYNLIVCFKYSSVLTSFDWTVSIKVSANPFTIILTAAANLFTLSFCCHIMKNSKASDMAVSLFNISPLGKNQWYILKLPRIKQLLSRRN